MNIAIKPMRERNQVSVAIWGTILTAAVLLLAVNLGNLPFVNSTNTYYANFANADGLKSGDDVRVEGISVGSVDSVAVQGDHVHVDFDVKSGIALGASSRRQHRGRDRARQFVPAARVGRPRAAGREQHDPDRPDGRAVLVARRAERIRQLLRQDRHPDAATSRCRPSPRRSAASRRRTSRAPCTAWPTCRAPSPPSSSEVSSILQAADSIVATLNKNSGALVGLLMQGDEFLQLVEQRHAAITQLLRDTARLGAELQVLMDRNGAQLDGAARAISTRSARVLVQGEAATCRTPSSTSASSA